MLIALKMTYQFSGHIGTKEKKEIDVIALIGNRKDAIIAQESIGENEGYEIIIPNLYADKYGNYKIDNTITSKNDEVRE